MKLPLAAAAAVCALSLGACQTSQVAQTVGQLAGECAQLQQGLAVVDVFVDSIALTGARALLYGVCTAPTNNPSALTAVRQARQQVDTIAQAEGLYVPKR